MVHPAEAAFFLSLVLFLSRDFAPAPGSAAQLRNEPAKNALVFPHPRGRYPHRRSSLVHGSSPRQGAISKRRVSEALRAQPYVPKTNITTKVEPADAALRLGRFDAEAQRTVSRCFSPSAGTSRQPPVRQLEHASPTRTTHTTPIAKPLGVPPGSAGSSRQPPVRRLGHAPLTRVAPPWPVFETARESGVINSPVLIQ